jgi:hypothetical protein
MHAAKLRAGRYARPIITEQRRRQMNEFLPYGLALEGLAITQ